MIVLITESQFNKLKLLCERGSMKSLKNIINIFELDDFQTFTLASAFILEKAVISLDTGLGKTLISGGLINLDESKGKWLFVCKNNNLMQTAIKLNNILYDRTVQFCSGGLESIRNVIDGATGDVILITYDALNNLEMLNYLFDKRKLFSGIIIDESHNIGNKGSNRSEVLKHMMKKSFRYQYLLTATPLSINPFQIINQINMIDSDTVPDPEALAIRHTVFSNGKAVGFKDLDELYDTIQMRYISFTRKELGLKGNYHLKLWLEKYDSSFGRINKPDLLKAVKSESDNECLMRVVDLVKQYCDEGKVGLIYANLSVYKDLLYEALKDVCPVCIIDGSVNATDKSKIQKDYNDGIYSVLISNIQEGQDLPSDFIIFYELTVKYKQFIGRGERGLKGNNMDIHFVLFKNSYEVDFFYNNVYKRSLLLETLCKKDVSEIREIEKQMSGNLSEELNDELEISMSFYDDMCDFE